MIKYIAVFLNDRTAIIRLDRKTGNQELVKIGVS